LQGTLLLIWFQYLSMPIISSDALARLVDFGNNTEAIFHPRSNSGIVTLISEDPNVSHDKEFLHVG